jgi:GT2 family glycosyltransferase
MRLENPKVSVVVAVSRDRPLYEESLKRQSYANYEVLPIKGYTAAVARNIGIKKAKGEIVAFIDDDVVLPQGWMSKGVQLLQDNPANIVGGPNIIFPDASIGERLGNFLISTGIFNGFRKKFSKAKHASISDYKDFATCNIMMRRSVFEKAGYFNEKYRYTEDMEFLLRCNLSRLIFYYSPDFFLYHKRRSFPFGHMKQLFFWGYGNMQMAFDYPFVFKRPDIWGSLILLPASLTLLYLYFKPIVFTGLILFPVTVHFLSYSLGAVIRLMTHFTGRKQC